MKNWSTNPHCFQSFLVLFTLNIGIFSAILICVSVKTAKHLTQEKTSKHYLLLLIGVLPAASRRTRNWRIIHTINGRCCEKVAEVWPSEIPRHVDKVVHGKFFTWSTTQYVKQTCRRTLGCISMHHKQLQQAQVWQGNFFAHFSCACHISWLFCYNENILLKFLFPLGVWYK